ncbi:MAG: hypothetical protein JXQ73_07290 [Phycisphaerae bacterium]|nr:hypothetical protein [Phycisphaerae bacterium]
MCRRNWLQKAGMVLGLATVATVLAGCVTVEWPGGGTSDPNKVTVWLVNASAKLAVEPLLYATGEAVVDPATELFIGANKVGGIGFAGTGLIPSGQSEKVELDCTAARVIGTPGARFADADSGTTAGTGEQKILSQSLLFNCGATVTFTFQGQTGGSFETRFDIKDP